MSTDRKTSHFQFEPLVDSNHEHGHAHSTLSGHFGHGAHVELGFVEALELGPKLEAELAQGEGRGKVLFLQMPSGIAGDMTIAALLDLGVPFSVIQSAVDALSLDGVTLVVRRGFAGAIGCTHFEVCYPIQSRERSYREIVMLLQRSTLDDSVKDLALRIFTKLGNAEALVHNSSLAAVQFHEVGALDSIVDIVGAAAAFVYLGAKVAASPVPVGSGFVTCRHGVLPLPAPATIHCLQGIPTYYSGLATELVTPTGAAILATVAEQFAPWVAMRPLRVGWGAGTKGLPDRPNALRAILGEPGAGAEVQTLTHALLESNIDDMTGEGAAHALGRIIEAGALDCWIVPATMKKGRPGMILGALTTLQSAALVATVILTETTSLGVRQTLVSRYELPRRMLSVMTEWGAVRVKVSDTSAGQGSRLKPEFDDCSRIARENNLPLAEVMFRAVRAATLLLDSSSQLLDA